MRYTLTQDIAYFAHDYAVVLDEIFEIEFKRWDDQLMSANLPYLPAHWPKHPKDLTCDHFVRGHFTEVMCYIDGLFGPCEESREACFRLMGVFHSKKRYTPTELQEALERTRADSNQLFFDTCVPIGKTRA